MADYTYNASEFGSFDPSIDPNEIDWWGPGGYSTIYGGPSTYNSQATTAPTPELFAFGGGGGAVKTSKYNTRDYIGLEPTQAGVLPRYFVNQPSKFSGASPLALEWLQRLFEGTMGDVWGKYQQAEAETDPEKKYKAIGELFPLPYKTGQYEVAPAAYGETEPTTALSAEITPNLLSAQTYRMLSDLGVMPVLQDYITNMQGEPAWSQMLAQSQGAWSKSKGQSESPSWRIPRK